MEPPSKKDNNQSRGQILPAGKPGQEKHGDVIRHSSKYQKKSTSQQAPTRTLQDAYINYTIAKRLRREQGEYSTTLDQAKMQELEHNESFQTLVDQYIQRKNQDEILDKISDRHERSQPRNNDDLHSFIEPYLREKVNQEIEERNNSFYTRKKRIIKKVTPPAIRITKEMEGTLEEHGEVEGALKRIAGPINKYNCHGYTFLRSSGWLEHNIEEILSDQEFKTVEASKAKVDDVVIYRKNGKITHSGVIKEINENNAKHVVESKWGNGSLMQHFINEVKSSYGEPQVYHSDIPNARHLDFVLPIASESH